ncbi:MAG TPA: hypothetical protein DCD96_04830 [Flavobacteriales bacterium]|nr:hypothetical protein [Flavobacteriales bacterium]HRE75494.1 hypothetical protein [Flavobacteriales bacterium]HRJ34745.1 hypothetical protein [Flavobacteriales bacterium]HRJ37703.1 hypothetical protein [Flavobacteriales bacterium]
MKKNQLIKMSLAALAGAFFIQGCTLVKDIEYKVNPNPVEMHGDTVTLNINGKFVEKGLHKKAVVEVTPVIIGSDGQERAFKTETFQGPKAAGNGKVIPKEGGSFSYTAKVPYTPNMEVSEIKVKILPKKGTKEKALITTDKIADGTIITPYLMMSDDKVIFGKDKFVRVTSHTAEMVINYEKGRHEVRGSELKDKDYVDFMKWVAAALKNERIDIKNITIPAYASPEGEIAINSTLADDRARTAAEAIAKEAKKMKWEKAQDAKSSFYVLQGKGEDWDGFKTELEATNIADKELILRVLSMYSDVNKREQEIRNMAKTFQELEKKVLPKLRRSAVTLNYDLTGKTDQELTEWSKSKPDSLTIEELLFAATLSNDLNEKLRIYNEVSRIYPNDWRGFNNAGAILFMQGKLNDANSLFDKAAGLASSESIIKNNLAACARQKGDRAKAEKLLGEASGAGDEVSYNMGLLNIQKGKYGEAVSQMSKFKTFNLALAQLLNGNGSEATSTLDGSQEKDAALSFYLRAIIAARANKIEEVKSNLTSAIQKDSALKAKAAKDREFLKFASDASFQAIVK